MNLLLIEILIITVRSNIAICSNFNLKKLAISHLCLAYTYPHPAPIDTLLDSL